jgi:glutamate/tyrosine decarboxylase-like PLP-dependent enzyme
MVTPKSPCRTDFHDAVCNHPTFSAATVMMTNFRQSPLDREVFAPFCYVELRCIDDPRHLLEVEPSAEGEISSHRWAEGRADP